MGSELTQIVLIVHSNRLCFPQLLIKVLDFKAFSASSKPIMELEPQYKSQELLW